MRILRYFARTYPWEMLLLHDTVLKNVKLGDPEIKLDRIEDGRAQAVDASSQDVA
jgi:hypothetical protein